MLTGYYFITDANLSAAGNISDVRNAVAAGACAVQYRNKTGSVREQYAEALALRKICTGTTFLVNDRVDISLAVDADGVHIGQDDLPYEAARKLLGNDKIIGITVHNLSEAAAAEKMGADYLGVAPIFPTETRGNAKEPCGISALKEIRASCRIPLIAVGGITLENTGEVIAAGVDGLCAVSAVVKKPDVKIEIEKFQAFFK